ncbi:YcjF family protein [Photobacterium profundum]|uniref:G domain-containing protein n=1 Tax=Photobacterium profundum (strain SS9) TaxID=298386 RepID=Q6LTS2_PHOPR|nr:GTPase [Photobacterium profundum]CAG19303.1 hypothetical protein PBPRA0891 [Photobacterium profundum SS9]
MKQAAYDDYLGDSFNANTGTFDANKAEEQVENAKDRFNIILLGATGVGKSSLVNAFFGEDIVKAGVGKPITQHLEKVELKKKGVVLWDSKGIESKNYEKTVQQLKKDIEVSFDKAENINDVPHLGWLCIDASGARIEPRDMELINILKERQIPIVVVFTKVLGNLAGAFVTSAKDEINKHYNVYVADRFAEVNSVEAKITEDFALPVVGLEKLLDLSLDCMPEGKGSAKSALKKAQRVRNQLRLDEMISSAQNKTHIAAAAAGTVGASPIPGSDAPLIAAVQSKLIYEINSEFELDFNTSTSTSIVIGILGVTAVAQVAKAVVSNLLKFVPGAGTLVGGAISASTAIAITEAIGHAYIKVLEQYYDMDSGVVKLPESTATILDVFKTYFSFKR